MKKIFYKIITALALFCAGFLTYSNFIDNVLINYMTYVILLLLTIGIVIILKDDIYLLDVLNFITFNILNFNAIKAFNSKLNTKDFFIMELICLTLYIVLCVFIYLNKKNDRHIKNGFIFYGCLILLYIIFTSIEVFSFINVLFDNIYFYLKILIVDIVIVIRFKLLKKRAHKSS